MRRLFAVPTWAWLGAAFLIRLAFALKLGGRFIQTDEIGYVEPARQLAETGVLGTQGVAGVLPPVPAAFYAFFFEFGKSLLAPRLGLVLLGTLVCWLMERTTRKLTGSRGAGRIALIISAFYPYFVYYGGTVMSELPAIACLCAALALDGFPAGLAWAAAGLCRPQLVPTALIAILATRKSRLALLAGWLLPLGLWAVRNHAVTGRYAVEAHGGMALLHGTEFFDLNEQDTGVAMEAIRKADFYKKAEALPEVDKDRAYRAEAKAWMRAHPGQTVVQWARKFAKFWAFYPRTSKVYAENEYSHPSAGLPRWALVAMSLAFEPWLIVLGFWGLWERRDRRAQLLPAFLVVAVTCAVHTLVVSTMRYRVPIMPVMILGASAWLARRVGEPREADL